jgi:hypothetical protein
MDIAFTRMSFAVLSDAGAMDVGANAFVDCHDVIGVLNVAGVSRTISKAFFH